MSHLHPLTHPRAEIYSPALSVSAAGVGLGSRERSEPQNRRAIGVGGDLWDHRVPPNPHRDPSAPRSPPGPPLSAMPHTGAAPWRWTSHMGWFPYTSGHGLFSWCFVLPDCSPVLPHCSPIVLPVLPSASQCSSSAPHCTPIALPVLPQCSPIALPLLSQCSPVLFPRPLTPQVPTVAHPVPLCPRRAAGGHAVPPMTQTALHAMSSVPSGSQRV